MINYDDWGQTGVAMCDDIYYIFTDASEAVRHLQQNKTKWNKTLAQELCKNFATVRQNKITERSKRLAQLLYDSCYFILLQMGEPLKRKLWILSPSLSSCLFVHHTQTPVLRFCLNATYRSSPALKVWTETVSTSPITTFHKLDISVIVGRLHSRPIGRPGLHQGIYIPWPTQTQHLTISFLIYTGCAKKW